VKRRFVLSALALAAVAIPIAAQTTSSITGLIRDQSQAQIPGAQVVVKAVETGVQYRTQANSDGYYTVPSLPALTYTVSAEWPGFKTATSAPFKLDTATTARIDLTLLPADSKQVVEVTAAAPAINTESGVLATTVSSHEISSIPVQGRNALELVATVAGVGGEMTRDEMVKSLKPMSPGSGVSIGGGRLSTTSYLTDGTSTTGLAYGRATITLSTDTVQELKIITNNYSAQYGSVGSGVVSMVSKSGTDQLHGSAFWSQRNPALGARPMNGILPPSSRRNEFGVVLGGPVYLPKLYDGRHRTFFFVSVEPKRYSNVADFTQWVPTAAERQGDLRDVRDQLRAAGVAPQLIYQQVQCSPSDANCQQLVPINRATTASLYPLMCANCPPDQVGHVIPKQYLDPTAQKILSYVPLPNMPYDSSGRNFFGIQGSDGKDNRRNFKVDEIISSKHRLSGRYTDIPISSTNFNFFRAAMPQAFTSHLSKSKQPYLSDTYTISPRMVNELRLSYVYGNYNDVEPYDLSTKNYTTDVFGLPNAANWGVPSFNISASQGTTWGMNSLSGLGFNHEHQYQFADDLTMVFGKHTMITGVDLRHQQMNIIGGDSGLLSGSYTFSSTPTQSGNSNAPGGLGGDAFAAFLLGIPNQMQIRSNTVPYYYRWKVYAGYFQDDYKVQRNLTLNLGLRYEYNSPRAEKYNRQASIDLANPVALTNAQGQVTSYTLNYLYSGFGRSDYLEPVHKNGWEPRFGFAWTPGFLNQARKLVIRGGYGLSHMPETGRSRFASPNFGATTNDHNYVQWTGSGAYPASQAVNPGLPVRLSSNLPTVASNDILVQIPANGILCAGCTPVDSRVPGGALIAFAKSNQLPYLQSWNLTIQKELVAQLVVSLSYAGSKGTHLYSPALNVNSPDVAKIGVYLDQGLDPSSTVADPFGRVNANGTPLLVKLQDLARPYPTVGDVIVEGITTSNSIYHAGTAEIERRFAGALGFRVNYTWSKTIDNVSDSSLDGSNTPNFGSYGSTYMQNPLNLKAERSVSIYDARHRLNYIVSAELPFGKGKPLLGKTGRLLNTVVGGWQMNVIGTLRSGYPLSVALGDTNGFPSVVSGVLGVIRPDAIPGVPVINPLWNKSVANSVPYVNPAAFSRPAYARMGDAARTFDYARGPWAQTLDGSLMKSFYPFERRSCSIRLSGEFYNLLNHAVFTMPTPSLNKLFSGTPPVSSQGLSLAGPIPYYPGTAAGYPAGSREAVLASYYNSSFGVIPKENNGSGRTIQFVVRLSW